MTYNVEPLDTGSDPLPFIDREKFTEVELAKMAFQEALEIGREIMALQNADLIFMEIEDVLRYANLHYTEETVAYAISVTRTGNVEDVPVQFRRLHYRALRNAVISTGHIAEAVCKEDEITILNRMQEPPGEKLQKALKLKFGLNSLEDLLNEKQRTLHPPLFFSLQRIVSTHPTGWVELFSDSQQIYEFTASLTTHPTTLSLRFISIKMLITTFLEEQTNIYGEAIVPKMLALMENIYNFTDKTENSRLFKKFLLLLRELDYYKTPASTKKDVTDWLEEHALYGTLPFFLTKILKSYYVTMETMETIATKLEKELWDAGVTDHTKKTIRETVYIGIRFMENVLYRQYYMAHPDYVDSKRLSKLYLQSHEHAAEMQFREIMQATHTEVMRKWRKYGYTS